MGNIMWKEIKSEKDIELFMREVVSFHDSCIREIYYNSGTYVNKNRGMIINTNPTMYIRFDTQISERFIQFELELGKVDKFSMNIDLQFTLEIYSATFLKKDNWFYWYSDEYADKESVYMFRCQTVKWRILPDPN